MNKEQKKQYQKEYYLKTLERRKEYYIKNKEYRNQYEKEKYLKNKEKRKEYKRKYNLINSEKKKLYQKEYNKNKPLTSKEKDKKWKRDKYKNNSLFKLITDTRNNINKYFRNNNIVKNIKTQEILGCTFEEFKMHLESLFESWMNWDNHGDPKDGILELNKTWDIDHIIPISSAKTENDIIRLNHYTNLRPLCSYINRHIKRNLIDYK